VGGKLGDLPTMKVEPGQLQDYARRADREALAGKVPSAPEIKVAVEYLEDPPTAVRNQSKVRPVASSIEGATPEAVPVIAVSRDDLAWFELESDAHAVLAVIDGKTTIEEIVGMVALDPERTLQLLRELEVQCVIALA
jgi:hypothetical protein